MMLLQNHEEYRNILAIIVSNDTSGIFAGAKLQEIVNNRLHIPQSAIKNQLYEGSQQAIKNSHL